MFTITTSSHPSSDLARPSLVLSCQANGKSYLFGNISEGAQRLVTQNKLGLNKVSSIFLTGKIDWDAISGLPGFLLTSADQGRTSLSINYGSVDKCLHYVIATWRYFVFRFGLKLSVNELSNGDIIEEDGFKVVPISINRADAPKGPAWPQEVGSLSKMVDRVFPRVNTPRDTMAAVAMPDDLKVFSTKSCNYIIEFDTIRGKFLVQNAKALKIPPGQFYSRLTKGETVALDDGRVITPDQVLAPPRHFGKVLILDIPDEGYLHNTLSHEWGQDIQLVYHLLGEAVSPEVLQSAEYLEFFQSRYPNATHVISHRGICSDSINFHASAALTLKLKAVNNDLFRLPVTKPNDQHLHMLPPNAILLTSLQQISMKPDLPITIENPADVSDYWNALYDQDIAPLHLEHYTKEQILSRPETEAEVPDVEIITLGTGSALPSKYRNVISTVVRIPLKDAPGEFNSIVLDAGENSIGTIKRLFIDQEYIKFFRDELSLIYLSHLHADHHLGIVSLINVFNRHNTKNRKLVIICPWQYDLFLKEWFKFNDNTDDLQNIVYYSCELFEQGRKLPEYAQRPFQWVDTEKVITPRRLQSPPVAPDDLSEVLLGLGIRQIQTCKAYHCEWAYCVSITFERARFKISYSGDTRPVLDFVKMGADSDVLIHEATLENTLIQDALDKRHTTILEAKYLAALMRCKNLVLTHFSQRYPKLPQIQDEQNAEAIMKMSLEMDPFSIFKQPAAEPVSKRKIIYAFDNMWFKLRDIHQQFDKFSESDISFLQDAIADGEEEADATNDRKRRSDAL